MGYTIGEARFRPEENSSTFTGSTIGEVRFRPEQNSSIFTGSTIGEARFCPEQNSSTFTGSTIGEARFRPEQNSLSSGIKGATRDQCRCPCSCEEALIDVLLKHLLMRKCGVDH